MRPIFLTMAAIAVLALTAPASAQWGHDRNYSHQLQIQIDTGVRQSTISRRERVALREDLSRLMRLERQFGPKGISGREHAVLKQRSTSLAKDIRIASRNASAARGDTAGWGERRSADNYLRDYRFDGPIPGDRFKGDIRVGQRVTDRIAELPVRYPKEYLDNDRVYYGYGSSLSDRPTIADDPCAA